MTPDPRTVLLRLLSGAVLVLAACASTPDRDAPPDYPGCYFFAAGEAMETFRLPEGVQLTERALTGWPAIMQRGDVKVAVTLRAGGTADYPFGYWLAESGALEVGYPSGGGIVMELEPDGDGLAGTARALGDTAPLGETPDRRELPVRLEKRACPDG